MPKNQIIYFTKDPRFAPTLLTTATGTNAVQIFAPSVEGTRVTNIIICSTSATQMTLFLQLNANGVICKLGHITVPAGAGTNGSVACVAGFNTGNLPWLERDANGNGFVDLNFQMNLEVKLLNALSTGEQIDIAVKGANYDA